MDRIVVLPDGTEALVCPRCGEPFVCYNAEYEGPCPACTDAIGADVFEGPRC
jgi:hypothetical protein